MMKIVRIVYPLVVIAAAVGLVLGLLFQLIGPQLVASEKMEVENSLRQVISSAVTFTEQSTNGRSYYLASGSDGTRAGFVFKTGEKGYGGPVISLVGITNGAVEKVLVLRMDNETPGLGTKVKDPLWLQQFSGITPDRVPRDKPGFKDNGMDAVSGATLTSVAVANGVRDAFSIYASLSDTNRNDDGTVKKKKRKKRTVPAEEEGGNEN